MKGIVYEIYIDSDPNIRYIGSTIQTLEKRWQVHKANFNTEKRGRPIICHYFKEFGIDRFRIRVIKEYEVVDIKHLVAYEQLWINKLKPINLRKILVATKQMKLMQRKIHYENNIESLLKKSKLYRENNRESIREQRKKIYICPCSPDKELLKDHQSRHERTKKHQKYLQSLEETKE